MVYIVSHLRQYMATVKLSVDSGMMKIAVFCSVYATWPFPPALLSWHMCMCWISSRTVISNPTLTPFGYWQGVPAFYDHSFSQKNMT